MTDKIRKEMIQYVSTYNIGADIDVLRRMLQDFSVEFELAVDFDLVDDGEAYSILAMVYVDNLYDWKAYSVALEHRVEEYWFETPEETVDILLNLQEQAEKMIEHFRKK